MPLVLIRGTGDVGSAVALALFRAGHCVVLHDQPKPAHARRGAAFTDALFEGKAKLEEVWAKRAPDRDCLRHLRACKRGMAAVDWDPESFIDELRPDVLVDARMRKREPPEIQRGLAPLTIGLGPLFVAGETTDLVIETAYSEELGAVIRSGSARPLSGEPRLLGRHGRERFVYAPLSGLFSTEREIGSEVSAGEIVASIDATPLAAPLSGRLRGLSHDGAYATRGAKVIEVDPSATGESIHTIGERPRRIADGVLRAVREAVSSGSLQI